MLRDIRDPQALGERLPTLRQGTGDTLSQVYDYQKFWLEDTRNIPNYKGEMTGFYTARKYRQELEARESVGDIYAASTLERIVGASHLI